MTVLLNGMIISRRSATIACQCFHCFMAQSSEIFRRFNNTILTLPLFSIFVK